MRKIDRVAVCLLFAAGVAATVVLGTAKAASLPPGIMFSTLLTNATIQPKTGEFRIENQMQVVFLQPNQKGWTMLRKAEGEELVKFNWVAETIKEPYYRVGDVINTDLKTGEIGNPVMLQPGKYVLDFYTDAGKFYSFPFSVDKIASDDPFAGGDLYFMEGDWSDWGYFYYSDANPEQSISWKIWLRNKGFEVNKDIKIRIEVTRDKDKKLICTSRERMTHTLRQVWVRYAFDLISPMEGTSGGAYFKAKDLLAVDGAYTLTFKIDGAVYGVWKFNVAGGKLEYTGRTVRGKADPLTFIEGGRDAFWYKKQ